ncbi:MAG: hypothetical protein AB1478_07000 [Nitrospirota bacterium]
MKLKILSVDFPIKGKGIENYSFYKAPSFLDYDVVIIDPESISDLWTEKITPEDDGRLWTYARSDEGFGKWLDSSMSRRREEIDQILTITKGIVIYILRGIGKRLNIGEWRSDERPKIVIDRYNWLPYSTSPRYVPPGREIKIVNKYHPFNQYLTVFKDSLYFEAILVKNGRMLPIATNKVGEVIAAEYRVEEGKLIFLPPLVNPDPEKTGGVLIDCLRGALKWSSRSGKPSWFLAYSLPGETEVITKIKGLDDEISKIEKRKEEFQSEYNRFEMLKSLLYEQGRYGLEPAVREAFRILGFNVLNPDEYDEEYDLFSKEEDLIVIGEIEGSEKQVDNEKYRQLLEYVIDCEETLNGKRVKGILIGNGFIKIKPEERGEQFTDAAIRGCRSRRFCRITTFELYKAVQAVLSEAVQREEIKKQILNCEDEFKLSTILESKEVVCGN